MSNDSMSLANSIDQSIRMRAQEIQRELVTLEKRLSSLHDELYRILGIKRDTATRKTSPHRLTPDQARLLCGC